MKVFLIALAAFVFALLGMAVGVIFGNRSLRGSCGGLAGLEDEAGHARCEFCSQPSHICRGPRDPRHTRQGTIKDG